jgi:phosphocarrier protein HPr
MTMPNVTMSVMLTNAIGLHARPLLKLTQLAKTFAGAVEIALSPEGPWINAKSPVSVMRARRAAPCCMFVPNGPTRP